VPHVSPVESFLLVFVDKIERTRVVAEHPGQNVLAKVVTGIKVLASLSQHRNQNIVLKM